MSIAKNTRVSKGHKLYVWLLENLEGNSEMRFRFPGAGGEGLFLVVKGERVRLGLGVWDKCEEV